MRQLAVIAALIAAFAAGCSNVQDHPYWLANTDLKCDGIVVTGAIPLLDPVQAYSVCEDREGHLYFPNGVLANTTIPTASGLLSSMITQSAQVGAMLGGF